MSIKNYLKSRHLIGDKPLKVRNSKVINLGYRLMQTNTQNATKLYENAKQKQNETTYKGLNFHRYINQSTIILYMKANTKQNLKTT